MNKKEVLQVIRDPKSLTGSQLKEVEKIAAEHPYFQGAHTLVALGNKKTGSPNTAQSLVRAALYAVDRKYLKTLLNEGEIPAGAKGASPARPASVAPPPPKPPVPEVRREEPAVQQAVEEPEQPETVQPELPEPEAEIRPASPETTPPADEATLQADTAPEMAPFEPDPVDASSAHDQDIQEHRLSDHDHDDLLKEVFANLEALKKTKSNYLEVEKKLEDAEFEEAQAKAVQKAKNKTAAPEKKSPATPAKKTTAKTAKAPAKATPPKQASAKTPESGAKKSAPSGGKATAADAVKPGKKKRTTKNH